MVAFGRAKYIFAIFALPLVSGCFVTDPVTTDNSEGQIGDMFSAIQDYDLVAQAKPAANDGMLSYLNFAVATNPEIAALYEAEKIARSRINSALAQMRPQLSASSAVGGYTSDISNVSVERGVSVSLQVSQLVFDGGKASNSVSEAELGLALAQASIQTAVNRISAEAANAGVALIIALEDLTEIRQFQKELKRHVSQLKLIGQSGLIDRSVLDEVSGRLLEIDIAEQEASAALSIAKLDFSKNFGALEPPNSVFALLETLDKLMSDGLSAQQAPKVKEAMLRVMIAERELARAKSAFLPTINAQASSSSPMDPDENMSAQVGVMVNYQIGDGGSRRANLEAAKASLEQNKRSAQFEVENIETALSSFDERLNNTKNLLKLANKKLQVLVGQLNVAEKQIQTGQADVAKVFEIKLQLNEIDGRIRRSKAELAKTKIQKAAVLGLFSQLLVEFE